MGEPEEVWAERIELLYQVNKKTMKLTGNPKIKFLHCLPAFHNRDTKIGEDIYRNWHFLRYHTEKLQCGTYSTASRVAIHSS